MVAKLKFRGEVLKTLRKSSGLSRPQLAELLDVDKQHIYNMEMEQGQPSLKVFMGLCLLLDVMPNTLLGWEQRYDQQ